MIDPTLILGWVFEYSIEFELVDLLMRCLSDRKRYSSEEKRINNDAIVVQTYMDFF